MASPRLANPKTLHFSIHHVLLVFGTVTLSENLDGLSPPQRSTHDSSESPKLLRICGVVELGDLNDDGTFWVAVEEGLGELGVERAGIGVLDLRYAKESGLRGKDLCWHNA